MKKSIYILCFLVLITFLVYPLFYVVSQSFIIDNKFTIEIIKAAIGNYILRTSLIKSFSLGIIVVFLTSLIGISLAFFFYRYAFRGREILKLAFFLPLIASPFVGAIGIRQILSRFGSLNLILIKLGILKNPISWIGSGFAGIVLLQSLHLYPIMFLNISAALNNFDIECEEASFNLGATFWQTFRKITFPLLLPGYFAAASIIFIWSITDLGTPLVFDYPNIISVQIFNHIKDINTNPVGYALVLIITLITLILFVLTKEYIEKTPYITGRTKRIGEEKKLDRKGKIFLLLTFFLLIFSLIPHIGIILSSFSKKWFFTVFPSEYTTEFYKTVFTHHLTKTGIFNSLFLSSAASLIDVILGFSIGYFLARENFKGKQLLDLLVMLPVVIPGIIIAFGYFTSFSNTILDPRNNPFPLLAISYSIRRLPFIVRSTFSSFQMISSDIEMASYSLGATSSTTFRKITIPMVSPGLFAGCVFVFAFSFMEVSSSLILAVREKFYPVAKVIYILAGRITDGPYVACALGVIGMIIITVSIFISSKLMKKGIGEFFRLT